MSTSLAEAKRPLPPLFRAVLGPIQAFLRFEAAGGVLLLLATAAAMIWANSSASEVYRAVVNLPFHLAVGQLSLDFTLHQFINDGLMSIFFFVVGMEIKRELAVGELRTMDRAMLPGLAAVGGMVVPAGIYAALNWGTPEMSGWAIPMATDIAFAVGLVTLLKGRVAWSLIVFLTALAIFDDMGGILVIAIFYGTGIHFEWLALCLVVTGVLFLMGRAYVRRGAAWFAVGAVLWYCVHHAGIHATIAGVVLGLMIPARARHAGTLVIEQLHSYLSGLIGSQAREEDLTNDELLHIEERLEELEPPLNRFVHLLHGPVVFLIVPIFALVNAGVDVRGMSPSDLLSPVPLGIALGLFVGKQVGIFVITWAVTQAGWCPLPSGGSRQLLWGISLVAGVGFTVALFVAGLAFAGSPETLEKAKLGILVGSLAAAVCGGLILRLSPRLFAAPAQAPAQPAAQVPAAAASTGA